MLLLNSPLMVLENINGPVNQPTVVNTSLLGDIEGHEIFDKLKQIDWCGFVHCCFEHQGVNCELRAILAEELECGTEVVVSESKANCRTIITRIEDH
jgi:hypothetical protein